MKKLLLLITTVIMFASCTEEVDMMNLETEDFSFIEKRRIDDMPLEAQIVPQAMHVENTNAHFKVYIIPDGFTSSEMYIFSNYATNAKNTLLQMEPFASNSNKINFYKTNTISNESGYSILNSNGTTYDVQKDTRWGTYTNNQGLTRYYGIPDENRQELVDTYGWDSKGEMVFIIIISNNSSYGAYGQLATYAEGNISIMITSISSRFDFLIKHEFGHNFGDLDDEYLDSEFAGTPEGQWLLSQPNQLNVLDYNPGGWLQGAKYVTYKYRFGNDIMKSSDYSGYHSRNLGLVADRITDEAVTKICDPVNLSFNPEDIKHDIGFRRKDGTGWEYHFVVLYDGSRKVVVGKFDWRNCDTFYVWNPRNYGYDFDTAVMGKVWDTNYYMINEWQDWDGVTFEGEEPPYDPNSPCPECEPLPDPTPGLPVGEL